MIIDELNKYEGLCNIGIYASDGKRKLFAYNENQKQDAACTLKVFIMLEYVRRLYTGLCNENDLLEVKASNFATGAGTIKYLSSGMKVFVSDLVELMVAISDHMAANILIDYLGLENINQTIQMFGFKNTHLFKKYLVPKNDHVGETTAYEYALFFKKLDQNEFFSPECCNYMKGILLSQRYKDFLAEPLFDCEKYIDMQCKSGKVDGKAINKNINSCVNDGGLCLTTEGNYYISYLSEIKPDSNVKMEDMKEVMHKVSKMVFERFIENEIDIC